MFIKIPLDKAMTTSTKKKKIPRGHRGFLSLPAISILNGRIVTVQKNKYRVLKIDNRSINPVDFVEILADEHGYSIVYILDINGMRGDTPQLKTIRKLSEVAEIWVDAGVMFGEHIIDFFVAGAERVVIGSKTIDCLEELEVAHDLSENIMFGLDIDHNKVVGCDGSVTNLPPIELVKRVTKIGIKKMVFTDLGRIGGKSPIDYRLIRQIVSQNVELYVGGGVSKFDISAIRSTGARGALVELKDIVEEIAKEQT